MSDVTPPSEPPVAGPPPPPPGWPPPPQASEPESVGEPASPKRRVGRVLGIALALAFVLTAGSVAVALFALRGSPDSLGRMVPANTDVYFSVNLDPGVGQKAALARLATKFPSLRDASAIRKSVENALDQMLRSVSSDLSFRRDVEPWLGSQVALIARVGGGGDVAVVVASKDDGAAEAALARVAAMSGTRWSTTEHGGVTVHAASGGGRPGPGAYAIVDHAAVFGSSAAIVKSVIDADEGIASRLTDSSSYSRTVASLPSDRLALLYINYPSLVKSMGGSGFSPGLFGSLSGGVSLDAYLGLGLSVTAQSDGLALDAAMPLDQSKLSATDRASISATRDSAPLIAWVPARAFGFLTGPALPAKSFLQALEGTPGLSPGLTRELRRLGVAGPGGLENHLTGDLVIEGSRGSSSPAGALLIGTDDEAVMSRTLERVARLFTSQTVTGIARGTTTVPPGQGDTSAVLTKRPHVRWATLTHDGVSIRYVARGGPPGLRPAYAVTRGMGIIASTPEELEAVLDTKAGAPSVATAPKFIAAISHGGSTQGDVIYLDLESLVNLMNASGAVPGDLRPLRTLIVTDHYAANRITERLFLSVK